jgi:hypothetical protein
MSPESPYGSASRSAHGKGGLHIVSQENHEYGLCKNEPIYTNAKNCVLQLFRFILFGVFD